MEDKKHHPILNGSTKKMIFGVTVMIGIITLVSLISLTIVVLENIGGVNAWRAESILGSLSAAGLSALARMTAKFMDTRTTQEKDKYRIQKYEIKMEFKTVKMKWNHKQEEIMKDK